MLGTLSSVDEVAREALMRAAVRIGLPEDGPELAALLRRLSDESWRDVERLWRAEWVAAGGYLEYPDVWVVDQLGEEAWSKQREIMRSVFANRKTAVVSSYGIGKDWTAARTIGCWLDQSAPGDAFVVSTAPTFAQIRAILWREVGIAFSKAEASARAEGRPSLSDRGHRLNLTEWWIGKELVGFGRKPSGQNAAGFQGIHARKVLVVLDEAGGVPEDLFEDAEKLVTTEQSRILAIGNPTHEGTYWHRVCNDPDWKLIQISAFDTPNFTGEVVPAGVGELLTSRLWVDEQRRKYGESSPRYQQQVLGRFTRDRIMTAVPLDWARASIRPQRYGPNATAWHERAMVEQGVRTLGVDPAGGGSDWTVIRERVGNRLGRQWRTQSGEPREQTRIIQAAAFESQASRVVIDSIGVGFGLVELVRQALPHVTVVAADAAESSDVVRLPDGRTTMRWDESAVGLDVQPVFLNKRAEWWWAGRERSMLASDPLYRPTVPGLMAWDLTALEFDLVTGEPLVEPDETLDELTTPGYEFVVRGKTSVIKVESKDDLRKSARLGKSTDHADAALLSFVEPPAAARQALEFGGLSSLRQAVRVPPVPQPGPAGPAVYNPLGNGHNGNGNGFGRNGGGHRPLLPPR